MKNISRLLIIILGLSTIVVGCRDEDVSRAPDFYTPVVLLGTNVTNNVWETSELPDAVFSFTLDEENFDGAADGHKFFVGRSGTTSSLIDVTLLGSLNGSAAEPIVTYQSSELPVEVSISATDVASTFGIGVDDLVPDDVIVITYEYNINADNSGTVYKLGTPGSDYCGGSTNEGEWCTFAITIVCTLADVVEDPTPGSYVIDFQDSFGDGWNNAAIEATIDGVTTSYTLDSGSGGSAIVDVPAGTSTLSFAFTSGDFDSEVTYQITAPAGYTMASGGPTPPVGTFSLSVCD